eukprot:Unigene11245_Nuclearia_a/m.34369 Unigene11245_Nuclearia_a/g.34369  ORF Unigene11245_Nuclearia_a/g.34369 Unigene11245_Nuclearia_a/m.34369 type:complete len:307 (+) Unigene11245_Nuclearia_a:1951-2871(+)
MIMSPDATRCPARPPARGVDTGVSSSLLGEGGASDGAPRPGEGERSAAPLLGAAAAVCAAATNFCRSSGRISLGVSVPLFELARFSFGLRRSSPPPPPRSSKLSPFSLYAHRSCLPCAAGDDGLAALGGTSACRTWIGLLDDPTSRPETMSSSSSSSRNAARSGRVLDGVRETFALAAAPLCGRLASLDGVSPVLRFGVSPPGLSSKSASQLSSSAISDSCCLSGANRPVSPGLASARDGSDDGDAAAGDRLIGWLFLRPTATLAGVAGLRFLIVPVLPAVLSPCSASFHCTIVCTVSMKLVVAAR